MAVSAGFTILAFSRHAHSIIGMKLNLNHHPDDAIHICEFDGKDGVLELDVVSHADAVLCHG
jgi:hypothetical protein